MTRIVKRFTFEAAHQLANHDGKCRNLHGHSYAVEVCVTGPLNSVAGESSEGMVVDFGDVKDAFNRRVHDRLDHKNLNDVLRGEVPVTSAEHIAHWILGEMRAEFPETNPLDPRVEWVRVYETATAYAEASGPVVR